MLAVLALAYRLEARARRAGGVGWALLATLVLGPLVAPIFFWRSRRSPAGLALGLGVTALASFVFLGAALGARALVLRGTLASAHAACMNEGPLARDPIEAKAEGPCAALVEAYESGVGCAAGAELVSCLGGGGLPFAVEQSPEKARAVLAHRCSARNELGACMALGQRAASDAERQHAREQAKRVCCLWWEAGVCERFATPGDCRR